MSLKALVSCNLPLKALISCNSTRTGSCYCDAIQCGWSFIQVTCFQLGSRVFVSCISSIWILIMWRLPFGYQIILAAQDHLSADSPATPILCWFYLQYTSQLHATELRFGSWNLFQNSWYSQVWCSSGLVDHIFFKFKGLAKIWWLLLCGYSMPQETTNPIIGQSTHSIHHFGSMLYHLWE